jgi:hypothetical protein
MVVQVGGQKCRDNTNRRPLKQKQTGKAPAEESAQAVTATDQALLDLLKSMQERLDKLECRPRHPKAELECFGCGEKGHFKYECPHQERQGPEHSPGRRESEN